MTITQLAAYDADYRRHLRTQAIADIQRAIAARDEQHAPTGALRRQLSALMAKEQ